MAGIHGSALKVAFSAYTRSVIDDQLETGDLVILITC